MIAFRPALPEDRALIVGTWLDSYRLSYSAGIIPMDLWYEMMPVVVERLIDKDSTKTIVAYETDEEARTAQHYGFISYTDVLRRPCVYYVFVLQPYREAKKRFGRNEGIATSLFRAAGIDPSSNYSYACKTLVVDELRTAGKIPFYAEFRPLIARFETPRNPRRRRQ